MHVAVYSDKITLGSQIFLNRICGIVCLCNFCIITYELSAAGHMEWPEHGVPRHRLQ